MDSALDVATGFCLGFIAGAATLYVYLYRTLQEHGRAIADEIKKELEKVKQ